MHAMAAYTTCKANPKQYAPIRTIVTVAGALVFLIGLMWGLAARKKATARRAAPVQRAHPGRRKRAWPLLLGLAVIGFAVFLGN